MKGVWCKSNIRGGDPCLEGTGIPTYCVRDRFVAGESVAQIAADYELTREQIEAGLRFELLSRRKRAKALEKLRELEGGDA